MVVEQGGPLQGLLVVVVGGAVPRPGWFGVRQAPPQEGGMRKSPSGRGEPPEGARMVVEGTGPLEGALMVVDQNIAVAEPRTARWLPPSPSICPG